MISSYSYIHSAYIMLDMGSAKDRRQTLSPIDWAHIPNDPRVGVAITRSNITWYLIWLCNNCTRREVMVLTPPRERLPSTSGGGGWWVGVGVGGGGGGGGGVARVIYRANCASMVPMKKQSLQMAVWLKEKNHVSSQQVKDIRTDINMAMTLQTPTCKWKLYSYLISTSLFTITHNHVVNEQLSSCVTSRFGVSIRSDII